MEGLEWHHAQHPAWQPLTGKEVGPIGAQAAQIGPEEQAGQDLQ
jgi:hypothetical protein